jgi:Zn-dependent protease
MTESTTLSLITFAIVLIGWIFSLCLHEFSHALVAYYGGDRTVKEKGYLTFNPLKYTHPLLSIVFPIVFLLLGGIGLPGGAVYIETWRLKNARWQSAVSLAGPLSNLVFALLLTQFINFFGFILPEIIIPGLAFLALLQVSAVVFNMIPMPPLDGYGIFEPHLDPDLRAKMNAFGQFSFFILFFLIWYVPFIGDALWTFIGFLAEIMGIPLGYAGLGYDAFTFWR